MAWCRACARTHRRSSSAWSRPCRKTITRGTSADSTCRGLRPAWYISSDGRVKQARRAEARRFDFRGLFLLAAHVATERVLQRDARDAHIDVRVHDFEACAGEFGFCVSDFDDGGFSGAVEFAAHAVVFGRSGEVVTRDGEAERGF